MRTVILLATALAVAATAGPHQQGNPLSLFGTPVLLLSEPQTVTLAVNSTKLRHGDWVSVSWSNHTRGAAKLDFIAWHSPPDGHLSGKAPVKFQATGGAASGTLTFRLLNSRQSGRFVFYTGGLRTPVALATSVALDWEDVNEPTQVHLDSPGTDILRVHWVTHNASQPTVRYGLQPEELTSASLGTTRSYSAADMCGEPATSVGFMNAGSLHTAVLTELEPGRAVYYTVGDAAVQDATSWSPVFRALVPPAPGMQSTVSVLVSADVGTAESDGSNVADLLDPLASDPAARSWFSMLPSRDTSTQMAAVAAHRSSNVSLWLHNGDISYALGYAALWESFMDQFADIMHAMPYHTAIGNHESNWPGHGDAFNGRENTDSGGECGVPYLARMPPPVLGNGVQVAVKDTAPWYSFNFGPIHFVQSSTEHSYSAGSPQRAWLEADLAAVDRAVTPWLVWSGHRPYVIDSYFTGDGQIGDAMRAELEPLWTQYGVDLTLTGHHHSYQRTCAVMGDVHKPVCARTCADGSAAAPVHVVTGHGGAGLTNTKAFRPAHFASVHREHGFAVMDANATHLWLRALRSSDGHVLDSFMLVRPRNASTPAGRACEAVPVSEVRKHRPEEYIAIAAASCAAASAVAGMIYGLALGCSALRHRYRVAKAAAASAVQLQEPLLAGMHEEEAIDSASAA